MKNTGKRFAIQNIDTQYEGISFINPECESFIYKCKALRILKTILKALYGVLEAGGAPIADSVMDDSDRTKRESSYYVENIIRDSVMESPGRGKRRRSY